MVTRSEGTASTFRECRRVREQSQPAADVELVEECSAEQLEIVLDCLRRATEPDPQVTAGLTSAVTEAPARNPAGSAT
jgi:hypothetical protein